MGLSSEQYGKLERSITEIESIISPSSKSVKKSKSKVQKHPLQEHGEKAKPKQAISRPAFISGEVHEFIDENYDDAEIVVTDEAAKAYLDQDKLEAAAGALLQVASSLQNVPQEGSAELADFLQELTF